MHRASIVRDSPIYDYFQFREGERQKNEKMDKSVKRVTSNLRGTKKAAPSQDDKFNLAMPAGNEFGKGSVIFTDNMNHSLRFTKSVEFLIFGPFEEVISLQ